MLSQKLVSRMRETHFQCRICKLVGEQLICLAGSCPQYWGEPAGSLWDIAGSSPSVQSGFLSHRKSWTSSHSPQWFSVKAWCEGHVSPWPFVSRRSFKLPWGGRNYFSLSPFSHCVRREWSLHSVSKLLFFKWGYSWVDMKRGNLVLCFCSCLEI